METESPKIDYKGKLFDYNTPLGILLDDRTGSTSKGDSKYCEIDPKIIGKLPLNSIRIFNADAQRQLRHAPQEDDDKVRTALRNTVELTSRLLEA